MKFVENINIMKAAFSVPEFFLVPILHVVGLEAKVNLGIIVTSHDISRSVSVYTISPLAQIFFKLATIPC